MNDTETKNANFKAKFVRDAMLAEIVYRREKMWKLFSWINTLLTAIIGGVIALKTRPNPPVNLELNLRIALTIAIVALVLPTCSWLNYNWNKVRAIWDSLKSYSHNDQINFVEFGKSPIRYIHAVALLGVATGLVIWL